jgi:predicted PurR-regulated permease PerM
MIGLFLGPILLAILMTAIQIYREDYLKNAIATSGIK